MFGTLGCLMVQKALSPGSPAGGSQALVTKEDSNLEVSFILRIAIVSLHSLNRFCFLRLGLFTLLVSNGAGFAGRSHSTGICHAE